MTTPDARGSDPARRPSPGPGARPVPPVVPAAFPVATSAGTPLPAGLWSPVLGIAAAAATTAGLSAVYGLILAESRHAFGYLLIIGGLGAAFLLAKTALPPIVRGAVGAALVGSFGFAATIFGSFGQLAKQASAASGESISFGTAVRQVPLHDALSPLTDGVWFSYAIAIIVSFLYGINGGMARYGRRR